jgi:hypothetical protein
MDPINTHQDLLLELAGSGDPTAFYTLIAQYANAAYIAERNVGKSHKEVLSLLIPFIKSAYQDFIKTSPHKAFDTWYREYKKKYFSNVQESSEEVNLSEKTDFGNIPLEDIAHFDRILDLILQRKYGKIQRMWNGRLTGKSRRLMRLIKTGAVFASAVILCSLLYFFLAITKQRIDLSYSFHGSTMHMTVPFSTGNGKGSSTNDLPSYKNSVPDSASRIVTATRDTVKIHDTVRVFTRWNASQNKTPAVS